MLNFIPKSYSVLLIVLEDELGTAGKFTSGCPAAPEVAPLITLEPSSSFCVPVTSGKILDVAVNLKKGSKDFGKVYYFLLNEGDSVYIPNCFAHGYECLSKNASIIYHLDNYRDAENESGISYNDKKLKIKWKTKKPILSLRDKNHFSFLEFKQKNRGL